MLPSWWYTLKFDTKKASSLATRIDCAYHRPLRIRWTILPCLITWLHPRRQQRSWSWQPARSHPSVNIIRIISEKDKSTRIPHTSTSQNLGYCTVPTSRFCYFATYRARPRVSQLIQLFCRITVPVFFYDDYVAFVSRMYRYGINYTVQYGIWYIDTVTVPMLLNISFGFFLVPFLSLCQEKGTSVSLPL